MHQVSFLFDVDYNLKQEASAGKNPHLLEVHRAETRRNGANFATTRTIADNFVNGAGKPGKH